MNFKLVYCHTVISVLYIIIAQCPTPHFTGRFLAFTESPYECPPAIAPLESQGRQGNKVLVEGRQTGSAKLSVRLAHHAYQVKEI